MLDSSRLGNKPLTGFSRLGYFSDQLVTLLEQVSERFVLLKCALAEVCERKTAYSFAVPKKTSSSLSLKSAHS